MFPPYYTSTELVSLRENKNLSLVVVAITTSPTPRGEEKYPQHLDQQKTPPPSTPISGRVIMT